MYSKTRNTLTALIAASLFVAAGWLFGHPIDSQDASLGMASARTAKASTGLHEAGVRVAQTSSALHSRHANRMTIAMPYYSFALLMPQRRAD